tara:strand:- start:654 stop:1094 length:441 start_codon:yes stop_codon:yes gene_type:complete
MTEILIKKLSEKAIIPKYETDGASGLDISACIDDEINLDPGTKILVPTGLSIAIPRNYEVQIRPRSGLAVKNNISVLNSPGTIDSDYRGEIKVILFNHGKKTFKIENGLRIAQMVVCPIVKAKIKLVENLSKTIRGEGGFGSTGVK